MMNGIEKGVYFIALLTMCVLTILNITRINQLEDKRNESDNYKHFKYLIVFCKGKNLYFKDAYLQSDEFSRTVNVYDESMKLIKKIPYEEIMEAEKELK